MIVDPTHAEILKLRDQNRRYKAAIARVRKVEPHYPGAISYEPFLRASDVLAALRLRK